MIAVAVEEGKVAGIEAIEIPRVADLMRIPDSPLPPEEVLRCLAGLPEPEEGREDESRWPYLEIRVLLTEPDPTFRHRGVGREGGPPHLHRSFVSPTGRGGGGEGLIV